MNYFKIKIFVKIFLILKKCPIFPKKTKLIRESINIAFKQLFKLRYNRIKHYINEPEVVQQSLFKTIIASTAQTEFGKTHNFHQIKDYQGFIKNVPLQEYETIKPYIERMMMGERDVLTNGVVKHFAKSSGTTNDKSKYIPTPDVFIQKCHIRSTWDVMTLHYHRFPDAKIFLGRGLVMGGSKEPFPQNPSTIIGDVSALMLSNFPFVGKPFHLPDLETALLANWDEKIERMARQIAYSDMRMLGGVPTWTFVLLRRVMEMRGVSHLSDVWPNLELYVHGGVSFHPYQEQFDEIFPKKNIHYLEIYNASEGFFSISDSDEEGMLLLLNNGIYYEFLPLSELHSIHPKTVQLHEVEVGVSYVIVITTLSGLIRYMPGDTVAFTSKKPYRIKVTGRTKQFVNAFGEEVIVDNTDKALTQTCVQTGAKVAEYTVGPIYFNASGKAGHEWYIEFDQEPTNLETFNELLDKNLQKINSDYEAKRYKNMALECLKMRVLPKGTFYKWLRNKGKFGGQNKVPRLANHRQYLEEIQQII